MGGTASAWTSVVPSPGHQTLSVQAAPPPLPTETQDCLGPAFKAVSRSPPRSLLGTASGQEGAVKWNKWAGAPLQPQHPLCRHHVGQDLTLPTHLLLLGDGLPGSGPHTASAPLTMAAQRFYRILHTAASAGEHEKVVQVTALSTLNFLSG